MFSGIEKSVELRKVTVKTYLYPSLQTSFRI